MKCASLLAFAFFGLFVWGEPVSVFGAVWGWVDGDGRANTSDHDEHQQNRPQNQIGPAMFLDDEEQAANNPHRIRREPPPLPAVSDMRRPVTFPPASSVIPAGRWTWSKVWGNGSTSPTQRSPPRV